MIQEFLKKMNVIIIKDSGDFLTILINSFVTHFLHLK